MCLVDTICYHSNRHLPPMYSSGDLSDLSYMGVWCEVLFVGTLGCHRLSM